MMDILLIDDRKTDIASLSAIIQHCGHHPIVTHSIREATNILAKDLPDMVIISNHLNEDNAYHAVEQFKSLIGTAHVAVIFLTLSQEEEILAQCLSLGDDYMLKPIVTTDVIAKLTLHLRVISLHQQLKQQISAHAKAQITTNNEHRIVEHIFNHQFKSHMIQADNLRYHLSPVSVFNGDVLLTAKGPSDNLYIAIGDVTGHGLPAAVGAMPVYSTFRTMAQKGLSVGIIAAEMNNALRSLLPDNMMLAAVIMEYNPDELNLTVWSGGMPPMIIDNGKGEIKAYIRPKHSPLAMLDSYEFSQDVDIYSVNVGERAYLYTDGVEESRNPDNEMFGQERLESLFDGKGQVFDRILTTLDHFTEDTLQDDDITLVELTFNAPQLSELATTPGNKEIKHALPWHWSMSLSPDDMRKAEPVPQIIKLFNGAVGLSQHQDYISTILSELYNNALDHGLLKLDSRIKASEDGFFEYYQLRSERLSALSEGFIDLAIDYIPGKNSGRLTITLKDSGDGFDYINHSGSDQLQSSDEDTFGRGVDIIDHFCESIEYSDGGSKVIAIYAIPH